MRILQLAWEHPPRLHGGLGRHVDELARALASDGHTVHVVAAGHPDAPARAERGGVVVHRAPAPVDAVWPVPGWPDAPWLGEVHGVNATMAALAGDLVAPGSFDVLHAHDWMVGDAALAVLREHGIPLVVTVHATERGRHQGWLPSSLSRWVDDRERTLVREADAVVVCSEAMASQVAEHLGATPDAVVPNGVGPFADPGPAALPRGAWPTAPVGARVLLVARLEHEKGVHIALAALERLRAEGRPVELVVAGDGTRRRALEERAGPWSCFPGLVDGPPLAALYAAADVVVVPSLYEPFGLVALEAMAAGAPVVASRTGGLAEQVDDGRTGLLVPPDDADALAEAVGRVLDGPRLAERLRDGGRAHAATMTWRRAAVRTARVYAGVTGVPPR